MVAAAAVALSEELTIIANDGMEGVVVRVGLVACAVQAKLSNHGRAVYIMPGRRGPGARSQLFYFCNEIGCGIYLNQLNLFSNGFKASFLLSTNN
jgi:hypothetical protein